MKFRILHYVLENLFIPTELKHKINKRTANNDIQNPKDILFP